MHNTNVKLRINSEKKIYAKFLSIKFKIQYEKFLKTILRFEY